MLIERQFSNLITKKAKYIAYYDLHICHILLYFEISILKTLT